MTQVLATNDSSPSSDVKATHLDNKIIGRDIDNVLQENKGTSLEEEEIFILNKASEREETFKHILLNESINSSWEQCVAYLLGITVVGFSSTLVLTLIPAHNLIQNPDYWYEILLHAVYICLWFVPMMCIQAASFLSSKRILFKENVLFIGAVVLAMIVSGLLTSYNIWSKIMNYQFPIPFLGVISAMNLMFIFPLIIWLRFPHEWRKNTKIRKRIKFFSLHIVYMATIPIVYHVVMGIIRMASNFNQPFFALSLPITREACIWIGSKFIEKCSNDDERYAKIIFQYTLSTNHAITLCYIIGSFATASTSWLLMSIDFTLNIVLCLCIVWTKKRHPYKIKKQIEMLQDLSVNEMVEFHAPLSFLLVINVAFYGPNAEIFGNIGNSYWTYVAIEDIGQTTSIMGVFFLVDFCSTLVSAVILWRTCQIMLWTAFLESQKEFGKFYCVILGHFLVTVSIL